MRASWETKLEKGDVSKSCLSGGESVIGGSAIALVLLISRCERLG